MKKKIIFLCMVMFLVIEFASALEIVNLTIDDFTVGERGIINIEIKNNDSGYSGEFAISVDCPSIFETIGSVPTIRLDALEIKTVDVQIINVKNIEEKECEICNVLVYNIEKTTTKDESNLQVCIEPLKICQEDDTRCVDDKF